MADSSTQLSQAATAKGVGTPTNSFAGDSAAQLGALVGGGFGSSGHGGRTHFLDEDEEPGDLTEFEGK